MIALGGKQQHGLLPGFRQILSHGVITLLAVIIAFSLPQAAKYILYEWWPRVETDPNLLLATEISLASVLVLLLNLGKIAWDHRQRVATARLAALVYARNAGAGRLSRWRERALLKRLPAARDAFVLTLTGHDTFVDKNSLLRGVLEKSYEIRAMLVNPVGKGLRTRVDTLPQDMTLLSLHGEIEASIAYLARLRKLGKKVMLKFYEDDPFWKVIVLGDHVWVQHFHSGFPANQQPEYVFALQHRDPRQGLFVPFYMHFLDRWNEPHHPAYDFDTGELVYRDSTGNESRRLPLGMSMNGTIPPVGASPPDRVPPEAASGKDLAGARAPAYIDQRRPIV